MATLTENVARVTSALADIKDAIISKGVVPTGKCETFADAIASIPTGGSAKVSSGTFTTSTSGTQIDLDFMPKQIWVSSAFNDTTSGTFSATETNIWSQNGYFEYYTPSTTTSGARINKDTRFPSVTDKGFTHVARYNNKTAYYIAVG